MMKRYPYIIIALICGFSFTTAFGATIAEPTLQGNRRAFYGNDRSVELLSELLQDADPLNRQQAVLDLVETNNDSATGAIAAMITDDEALVRAACAQAALELSSSEAEKLLRPLLLDKDSNVIRAALQTTRRRKLTALASDVSGLLDHSDPSVRRQALLTLTAMDTSAETATLETLLKSDSPAIRFAAAENARKLKDAQELIDTLKRIASDEEPMIREAALVTLAEFDYESAQNIADQIRQSGNPTLRRAALRTYAIGKNKKRVAEYLRDRSPVVRLEATRQAGEIKCENSVARLLSILITAPDQKLHDTARESLRQIGTEQMLTLTAGHLSGQAELYKTAAQKMAQHAQSGESPTEEEKSRLKRSERNTSSLCRLLEAFKSRKAYAQRLELLEDLRVDSRGMIDLAASLAVTGDEAAVEPMKRVLKKCRDKGLKWLIAQTQMNPPPVEYNEEVHAAIIEALCELKATSAANLVIASVETGYQMGRLNQAAIAAGNGLQQLATTQNRPQIIDTVSLVLQDDNYNWKVQFAMSKLAGRLKLEPLLPELKKQLNEKRFSKLSMQAAAWAIQQISGQTPQIGQPKLNENSTWIVRQLD